MPDALPAVTVPSGLNADFSFARLSGVVLSRINSSVSKTAFPFVKPYIPPGQSRL
jgi:hypothetical protein